MLGKKYDKVSSVSVEDAGSEAFNRSKSSVAVPVFDGVISIVLNDLEKGELSLFSVTQAVADEEGRGDAGDFGEVPQPMHVFSLK